MTFGILKGSGNKAIGRIPKAEFEKSRNRVMENYFRLCIFLHH